MGARLSLRLSQRVVDFLASLVCPILHSSLKESLDRLAKSAPGRYLSLNHPARPTASACVSDRGFVFTKPWFSCVNQNG